MRLQRFFIEGKIENNKELVVRDRELIHQLKDVFRFQVGAELILLDNSGYEFHCQILQFGMGDVKLAVLRRKEVSPTLPHELYLFFALIKKDRAEWVLEKGTELGVTHFVPILSDRSEKKNLNFERAEKIITEAAEQSGKATLPTLHAIETIEEAFNNFSLFFLALHPKGESFKQTDFSHAQKVGIFVGPEGGWSDSEIAFFKRNKIPVLSLGSQILRAETAAIAVSALLLL